MAASRPDPSHNPASQPSGKRAPDAPSPRQDPPATSFFSGAENFEIFGGNFSSVKGDMHSTHNYDHSYKSNFNNEYTTHNTNSHNTRSEYNDTYNDTRRMNYAAWAANQRTNNIMHHGQDGGRAAPRPYGYEQPQPGLHHQTTTSNLPPRGRVRRPAPPGPPASAPPQSIESREQAYARSPSAFDAIYGAERYDREPMFAGYPPSTRSSVDDQYLSSHYAPSPPFPEEYHSSQAAYVGDPSDQYRSPAGVKPTSPFKSKNPFAAWAGIPPTPPPSEPSNDSEGEMDTREDYPRTTSTPPPGFPSPW